MTAPHRSRILTVEPQWIDYNGHLNMAYYSVLMDRAADQVFDVFGLGETYRHETNHSTFSAEYHMCYLRELHEGDKVYVTTQLLDLDEKRFHFYQELFHEDGWLSAAGEGLSLHVDLAGPRVAPMPPDVLTRMRAMLKEHRNLSSPDRAGRKIGIPAKT